MEGITRQVDLATTRVTRLIRLISELRRNQFAREVFARAPSPLLPELWNQAFQQLIGETETISTEQDSLDLASEAFNKKLMSAIPTLAIASLVGIAGFLATRVGIVRVIREKVSRNEKITDWRWVMGGVVFVADVIPFSCVAAVFYALAKTDNLIPTAFESFARQSLFGFIGCSSRMATVSD